MSIEESPPAAAPSASATPGSAVAAMDRRAEARRAMVMAHWRDGAAGFLNEQEQTGIVALLRGAIAEAVRGIGAGSWNDAHERRALAVLLREAAVVQPLADAMRLTIIDQELRAARSPARRSAWLAGLLVNGDRTIVERARAYLLAENRLQGIGSDPRLDLDDDAAAIVAWTVVAIMRDAGARDDGLSEAAEAMLARAPDTADPATCAIALTAALDDVGEPLVEGLFPALAEAWVTLFCALLARAAALPFADVRDMLFDPPGDLLWVALRAGGVTRADAARIGFVLCEADPARDVEHLPDALARIWAMGDAQIRAMLAPLELKAPYRLAVRRLNVGLAA